MKIALIITRSDAIGGAHIHVRDLALRLIADGHAVRVLVGGEGPFTGDLASHDIPFRTVSNLVRPIHPVADIKAIVQLRRELARFQPDLVSTHSSKAGLLGRLAARSLGIPVIFTAHGWAFTDGVPQRQARAYVMAERWASRFCQKIITVSKYDREIALAHRIAQPETLVAIHNGMPEISQKYMADPRVVPPRIMMVARFEEQKDHATLLQALAKLRSFPWKLELVGDGPLRPAMETLASSLGVKERIDFVGAARNVVERLARSQIFALISNWEGFPRSILEAMRAGLPVIASDVGGVRESVAHGSNGFLVPRGDVDAVVRHLERLLTDRELRMTMGRKGRERFEREFTFEHMYDKTVAVYREVLQRGHD